jgi:ribosomal protein L32E
VTGEWTKLHIEELHNLYSSPDDIMQIKSCRMRWARRVARVGEERNVYKVLMRKPEGKRPLGKLRRRWEVGIRMTLVEIGWGGVAWIRLAQDRGRWRAVVNAVMDLRVLAPRS